MAITQDGTQKFGISSNLFVDFSDFLVSESLTENQTSSRVDLNNGDGEPSGAVTIPGRTEVSGTLQMGSDVSLKPQVGELYVLFGKQIIMTEVSLTETQADYRRYNFSAYVRTNPAISLFIQKGTASGINFAPEYGSSVTTKPRSTAGDPIVFNTDKVFQTGTNTVTLSTSSLKFGHFDIPTNAVTRFSVPINCASAGTFNSSDSFILANGVSFVTAQCSDDQITFTVAPTVTQQTVVLAYEVD